MKRTSASVLLHDNVRQHTAARTRVLPEHLNWDLFDHRPYSPDITQSNCHLFTRTYLKNWLRSPLFNNNEDLMEVVKTWLSSQATDFLHSGIRKLIFRYEKCLNSSGDYVEKYVRIFYI
jgi:hypothetical protein